MALRSYIDLVLFARVMRPRLQDMPPQLVKALETASDDHLRQIFGSEDGETPPTIKGPYWSPNTYLHETIHFWQGLSLPFVYMAAHWSLFITLKLFVELNKKSRDFHQWCVDCPPVLDVMSEKCAYSHVSEGTLLPTGLAGNAARLPAVSPLDLLEATTSVLEWTLEKSQDRSAGCFLLWSARHSSYPEAVRMLIDFVGDADLALEMFLPLCYESFHTSNPVRAFWTMAAMYRHIHPDTAGRVGRQKTRYRVERLSKLLDVTPADKASFEGADWNKFHTEMTYQAREFIRLSMPQVLNMGMGPRNMPHFTLYKLARQWLADTARKRDMADILKFPWHVSMNTLLHCFGAYQPFTLARFDLPGRTRVVPLGRLSDIDYVERVERMGPGISGSAAINDIFTIMGAVRRATGAFYAEDMRLCPHEGCPEFPFNYCNSWFFIHDHYTKCNFLKHFGWLQDQYLKIGKEMEEERHGR